MRLLPVLFLALAVRLVVPLGALAIHGDAGVFVQPDTNSYVRPAQALVEHGSFTATPGGSVEISRTPGYPLLLTLGVMAGGITLVTIAAQVLIGVGTVAGVALLARRLMPNSPKVARWAAIFYALDPVSVLYCSLLMTETLFAAMLVVHLLAVTRFLETRSIGTGVLAGTLAAASTFVRPVAYFWPVVSVAVMLCVARRVVGVRGCAAFLVAAMLPCMLWAVRNDMQAGYLGFSAIRDRNLYAWNAAGVLARVDGIPFDDVRTQLDARLEELEESGMIKTPAERSEHMGREGLRVILDHPMAFLRVHMSGIARTLTFPGFTGYVALSGGQPAGMEVAIDRGIWYAIVHLVRTRPELLAGYLVIGGILMVQLGAGALGVWRSRSHRTAAVWVLLAAAAYFLVIAGGPTGHSRFRHPVMPVLCVFAAVGVSRRPLVPTEPVPPNARSPRGAQA